MPASGGLEGEADRKALTLPPGAALWRAGGAQRKAAGGTAGVFAEVARGKGAEVARNRAESVRISKQLR